jgi:tRNA (guanine-N(7)-)-methyltransferase
MHEAGTARNAPRFFGRRVTRTLSPRLKGALDALLPGYRFNGLPDAATPVHLDIGFGTGDSVFYWRGRLPGHFIIGVEPFWNGVAATVLKLREAGCTRVRLFPADVHHLMPDLPPASVDSVSILFPDPWPKDRHAARRLVQTEFLTRLRSVLKPDGMLFMASDAPAYAAQMADAIRDAGFTLAAQEQTATPEILAGLVTRYQQKALKAGRVPVYYRAVNGRLHGSAAAVAYPNP